MFRTKVAITAVLATMSGLAGLATAAPASAAPAYYPLINSNSGKCMGVTSSDKVGQYTCTSAANQEWTFVLDADGDYYIKNKSGQCLYTTSISKGTQVYASTSQCSQTDNFVTWLPNDGPIITHANAGDCIGINAGSKSSGAQAIIWPYTGAENQLWEYDGAPA